MKSEGKGYVEHRKEFGFYSIKDEKPREDFESNV